MKICPIAYKICQSRFKIMPNTQQTLITLFKTFAKVAQIRQIWSHGTPNTNMNHTISVEIRLEETGEIIVVYTISMEISQLINLLANS